MAIYRAGIDYCGTGRPRGSARSQRAHQGILSTCADSASSGGQIIADCVCKTAGDPIVPVVSAAAPHAAGADDDAGLIRRVQDVRRVEIAVIGKILWERGAEIINIYQRVKKEEYASGIRW